MAFTVCQDLQAGVSLSELSGFGPEPPRSCTDFAEGCSHQDSAGFDPLDDGGVEVRVTEQVTEDEVDLRAVGKTTVEVVDLETAAFGEAVVADKLPGKVDGDGGDIDADIAESTAGKPHGTTPPAAGQFEGVSGCGEEVLMVYEDGGRAELIQRGHSVFCVAPVPFAAVSFAHQSHDT